MRLGTTTRFIPGHPDWLAFTHHREILFFNFYSYIKPFHFCLKAFSIIYFHLAFIFLYLFSQKENESSGNECFGDARGPERLIFFHSALSEIF